VNYILKEDNIYLDINDCYGQTNVYLFDKEDNDKYLVKKIGILCIKNEKRIFKMNHVCFKNFIINKENIRKATQEEINIIFSEKNKKNFLQKNYY
jgi:hypothetical protein